MCPCVCVHVYICKPKHSVLHLKLQTNLQHCKLTIPQLKKKPLICTGAKLYVYVLFHIYIIYIENSAYSKSLNIYLVLGWWSGNCSSCDKD